jgi:hypothetical protein
VPLPFEFDFLRPDYEKVYRWRIERLQRIRQNPETIPALKAFYKLNPVNFINDWGMTFDPRNAGLTTPDGKELPMMLPFILFEKQQEWIEFILRKWRERKPGLTEKTRDMGISWTALALSCTLCLHNEGFVIGFGSRKEDYVDKIGDPKSLFWKARYFMENLPVEFRGGWDVAKHAPHMRIIFPETNSYMTGEAGDGIGRGDRTSIYFVDEAAHLARPQLVEASLSQTTNCRQDISSVSGMANPFAQKRFSGKIEVFTYNWQSDPRKDAAWYEKQKNDLDPVTFAQEIDIDYQASVEGVVIPSLWINAAIGAADALGIVPTGETFGALDVADQGIDLNAFGTRKGIEIKSLASWSGKGGDILNTVEKMFLLCDDNDCLKVAYDADGLGAGVRGDSRAINDRRKAQNIPEIDVDAFRGSGEVSDPEGLVDRRVKKDKNGRKNKDFFANYKAQSWWELRRRFQETFRAVEASVKGEFYEFDPDEIISLPHDLPQLDKLKIELSQPTYSISTLGKILIDKAPDGTKSPNLADVIMMLFAPKKKKAAGMFS